MLFSIKFYIGACFQVQRNAVAFYHLVLSQEDAPQTHSTVRQIARETRIHTPGSTPVRQQHQCWRSFALFLACHYQTHLLSIQFFSNA